MAVSLFMLLPLVMFVAAAGAIVAMVSADAKRKNAAQQGQLPENAPAVTLAVQLTKKQTFVNPSQNGVPLRHFLTFATEDGAVLELEVPADAYEAFNEGEYGDLCVQGRQFLGFAPQAQALPFAQPLPQETPNLTKMQE